ncbi:MAG TPA: hypothetical protein VFG23_05030 [Polyangia bacterium]|nr:hypothetical protein [Polyangia bacterium]
MTRLSQALLVSLFVVPLVACVPEGGEHTQSRSGAVSSDPGNLDILIMVDNSSSMTQLQMKMLAQDPGFMTVLENLPNGLPNIHVAVVSSDLGAPSDLQTSIACTATGDGGLFQSTPRGTCTDTTLTPGATFISNVDGQANYTGSLQDVFGCIAQLGESGCGFEHQLASVARALGADGSPAPTANAGFLRDDAELAIVLLTNEDDCSATPPTTIYSLNGDQQNISNPDGPIANYRCNGGPRGAHYCQDPANNNTWIIPPLNPPPDAQGSSAAPTLDLANCIDNEQPPMGTGTSALTPVSQLISGIKALKADPDNQIVVGTISAPATPYTVAWVPEIGGQNTQPGELWPEVEHSCGPPGGGDVNPEATQLTTDGSFGDPSVRIAQWVNAFGSNGVVTSICDANYSSAFQTIANRIASHLYGGTGAGGAGGQNGGGGQTGSAGTNGAAGGGGATGTGGAAGTRGTAGVSGTAGGNGAGGTGGVAGTSGAAGKTGAAGSSGAAGTGGTSGTAGGSGTGTGGGSVAGGSGTGAGGGSVAGGSGTGTGGGSVAGGSGTGAGGGSVAGGSGTGAGGNNVAGASGTGAGGNNVAGASGTGAGGGGVAGTSGTGAGGTATAGTSGTGTGGSATGGAGATAGKLGSGTGGAGGAAGGHAGTGPGTGGTTTSGAASGCSCDSSGATRPGGLGLALLLGALLLAGRRRAAVCAPTSLPSRR